VLTPEIWIAVAEKTGIKELRRTPRRTGLRQAHARPAQDPRPANGLKLSDIQQVIGTLRPLEGAKEFSMTFARSFRSSSSPIRSSSSPRRFCANWAGPPCSATGSWSRNDRIVDYKLRVPDQKQKAVAAFKLLNYYVISGGDSFNDTAIADRGPRWASCSGLRTT